MPITPGQRAETRGLVGRSSFDVWYLDTDGPPELERLWTQHKNAYLVAADILTGLADPSLEGMDKLGDVQSDLRGQSEAYLAKAREYRRIGQQQVRQSARALSGPALLVGGVTEGEQAALRGPDPLPSRFGRDRP